MRPATYSSTAMRSFDAAPLRVDEDLQRHGRPSGDCGCCLTSICTPQALAQLGPMLCLYPAVDNNPLSGWEAAMRGTYYAGIDSDGPHESLLFLDVSGGPCWQLCLLPETDFLRWEQLIAAMPARADWLPRIGSRLAPKHPVARVIGSPLWRACPLQLHAVSLGASGRGLAAACAHLSPAGVREVARLAGRVSLQDDFSNQLGA